MERWKDIEGLEGKYQVSAQGRIRCMPRYVKCRGGYVRRLPMKVLELKYDEVLQIKRMLAGGVHPYEIAVVDLASGEEMPEEVMECLKDDTVIKTAFNAVFERTCINRFFHLDLQPESWRCTAVQASTLSLPLSLEGVGEARKLDKKKMTEGKELIRYFCVPCKPTKSNGGRARNLQSHAPEKWELFKSYCIRDVAVEMQIRPLINVFDAK